ncbi:50S ribosomal protein L9 [bioreactor metagenome]|jgi:large subunit ribosomal protein L9|uniref:50S ribosomal protein L9 n=1 Tax=bioreactor metagenome TaxID=1076179 RepID=A0A644VAM0_9ZZZZ|nr:50S ribosomal protein L9 [Bacteroidales bacterium]MDD3668223.1 50S ribosomal protein L9 [Bacteroidales bacterium]MDY4789378.1 50S ribosomal protein L9 [Bacteroidales bacterium]MEA4966962.1 50S ribosomal protein L9 [Bacteroidaceae bacterium]MEA5100265.1 50S ribosomal protein L9 [Bacteroidales bacterium]
MEIILKQDMTNLGYKDEIVKVKDGYANNFLIPQGYAMVATASNKKIIAENLKQRAFKEEKLRKDAETLVAVYTKIEGLKIGAKASENGKIFGSVNAIQLADSIKQQFDIEVDRKRISIKGDSIKTLGTYKAVISAYKDLKAEIEFEVVAE